jgi:hypothetical protein
MKTEEYIVWCDESVKKGDYYSNFYGGVMVAAHDYNAVVTAIKKKVDEIGITEEIKWQKVDMVKLPAFIALVDTFFQLLKKKKIKVRIMFTQNAVKAKGLRQEHFDGEYFFLYYQFFKHAFGFQYANTSRNRLIYIKPFFDYMPDTHSKRQQFKEYIKGLESIKAFSDAGIKLRKDDIAEVDSKKHLLLQMLDVVLGAIQFRLNNKHKEKPEGQRRRGKRTIAKERLYKHINKKIRELYPGFNIGTSTGCIDIEERWSHAYRHWCFKPKDFEIDETKYKH